MTTEKASLTETQVEEIRWRCQRVLRNTYGPITDHEQKISRMMLGCTRPGRMPTERQLDLFRKVWTEFFLYSST